MAIFESQLKTGNFKPSRMTRLKAKERDPRADREGDCEKHRAAIRKCPCSMPKCNRMGKSDPHHLKATGLRGMAMRSPDRFAIPLCRSCHEEIEAAGSKNELKWFLNRGIDALELAGALWGARGDAAAMTRVVLAHKISARAR